MSSVVSGRVDSADVAGVIQNLGQALARRETVIVCGAGLASRSGLPSAAQLLPEILDQLGMAPADRKSFLVAGTDHPRLPLETCLDLIGKNSNLAPLVEMYALSKPSTPHAFLAKLMHHGWVSTVVTTHFDLLIERALEAEGVAPAEYDLLYTDEQFARVDWSKPRLRLIKLHGSVHDRPQWEATLARVGGRNFSGPRHKVIRHVFATGAHKQVVLLGYSASEGGALSTQIEAITDSEKHLVYLEHLGTPEPPWVRISNPREHTEKNRDPFGHFRVTHLAYPTSRLVQTLWATLLPEPHPRTEAGAWGRSIPTEIGRNSGRDVRVTETTGFPESSAQATRPENVQSKKTEWKTYLGTWGRSLTRGEKATLAGALCAAAPEYPTACIYWEKALTLARLEKDTLNEGRALGRLGSAELYQGKSRKAVAYYKQALRVSRKAGDASGVGLWLGHLGSAYQGLGQYFDAIDSFEQALEITWARGDTKSEGVWLGHLGSVYSCLNDHAKAFVYFSDALEISRALGAEAWEGNLLGNLGACFCQLGKYRKAVECYKEALALARVLGDKRAEANNLGNLGITHQYFNKTSRAIECFERSLKCSQDIGDIKGEAISCSNLVISYHKHNDAKAVAFYQRALKLVREAGEKNTEGAWVSTLGVVYHTPTKPGEAFTYAERAYVIPRPTAGAETLELHAVERRLGKSRPAVKETSAKK